MTTAERGATQSIAEQHTPVIEHAVLIPTSAGPVGAVVTEPRVEPRCSLVLLPGGGDAGRSGINASWARAARAIAGRGLTVLRLDYVGTRESGVGYEYYLDDIDEWLAHGRRRYREAKLTRHRYLDEVIEWFRERTGNGIGLAGSCAGGRDAARLASRQRDIVGVACLVPSLGNVEQPWRRSWRHPSVLLGRRPPAADFTGVDRSAVGAGR